MAARLVFSRRNGNGRGSREHSRSVQAVAGDFVRKIGAPGKLEEIKKSSVGQIVKQFELDAPVARQVKRLCAQTRRSGLPRQPVDETSLVMS